MDKTNSQSIFRPGENCAAVAHAGRLAFIVDAEDYFRIFMKACESARCSILILGWDFDSRTVLDEDASGKPILLGEFLNGLARRNRRLQVRILDWDFPAVFGIDREAAPHSSGGWQPHRHVDFRFDDTHPVGGSHHQKIVVIDDKVAFSGGLDLTNKRWDTREHKAENPRRVFLEKPYPPFHDVMIGVDGEAAAALANIARERWHNATGETLRPLKIDSDPWPKDLQADLTDATVGVSCTVPPSEESKGINHVERLYLEMIERARDYIYMENQYFTSKVIGEALKKSLAQPQGPEILVVTRLLSHGWLEEITMTTLRTKLVHELGEADKYGRFHVFYPDVPGLCEGTCLDIHSKVTVIDDEWLRIGSANLSNRSMGMDTECDVTVEALGDKRIATAIREFRNCLLGEHTGAKSAEVEKAVRSAGTLAAAIATLGTDTRSMKKLECPPPPDTKVAIAKVGDPEAPVIENMMKGEASPARKPWFPAKKVAYILAGLVVAAFALALVWSHTPLKEYITRDNASALAQWFSGKWWAPLLVIVAYTPASFVMFPRWLITMTAVLAFGPVQGFLFGITGAILAGVATFLPGRLVSRDTVRRLAGPKMKPVMRFMENRGLIAVALVRLVPIAPFPVVNLVMGAMRVKLWHFVLGTFFGMAPGFIAATMLSDQLANALEDPARVNGWLIAVAILVLVSLAYFGQRILRRSPH